MPPKAPLLSEEDFRRIMREELAAHDERLGRDTSTIEKREEIRKDAEWTRRMRKRLDAMAGKVGYIVLTAIVGSVLAILAAGIAKLRD